MKKKTIIMLAVIGILFIGLITGMYVYVNMPAKESRWNIQFTVENVTPSGLTLHMTRNDAEDALTLYQGVGFGLERWTLLGWEEVEQERDVVFGVDESGALSVEADFSDTWEINWEYIYGKLPIGLYRISKSVNFYSEYEVYYAPFVVAAWWQVLLVVAGAMAVLAVVWLIYRSGILKKIIKLIIKNKKLVLRILAGTLISSSIVWAILDYFAAEITNARYALEVSTGETTTKYVKGTFTYLGDKVSENESYDLFRAEKFLIEKRTLIGWRKIKPDADIDVKSLSDELINKSIEEEDTKYIRFNWNEYYGELPNGTYRIKQAFSISGDGDSRREAVEEGYFYITFTISE